jgi:hypothetical protein
VDHGDAENGWPSEYTRPPHAPGATLSLQGHQHHQKEVAPTAKDKHGKQVATMTTTFVARSPVLKAHLRWNSSLLVNKKQREGGRTFAPLDGEQVDSHNRCANHVENRQETTTSM